ncbi:MAG: hypothetical protein ABIJ41_07585 [Candidatus Omnitrophota bacterium]
MSNPQTQMQMEWEKEALEKFNALIERIPLFHRQIAYKVVVKGAEVNAQERQSKCVEEQDIMKAFYSEVPPAFYSLMIKLLGDVGFDYKKYEPSQ